MAEDRHYRIVRASGPVAPDCSWNKPAFRNASVTSLEFFMGARPHPMPSVRVKCVSTPVSLSVIFRVVDHHVRCSVTDYQGPVYGDSCVEFFFTPGTDLAQGYFNIECNCGGTLLFHHQTARGRDRVAVSAVDAERLAVSHTMPRVVEPELPGPVEWCVEYAIPFDLLARYAPVEAPGPGAVWRGNFYKCADRTTHPHWLTWAPVPLPEPDFHRKEYFGTLLFQ